MEKLLEGRAISLKQVLEFNGYTDIFLIEASVGWNWDEKCRVDLGRKRIVHVARESYLAFVNESNIKIERIVFPEKTDFSDDPNGVRHPLVKITDYLKRMKIEAKTVSLPLAKIKWRNCIFSTNGYFLQDSGWCDCWTHACDFILNENQLFIDGKSVKSFSVSHSSWIDVDIMLRMKDEITKVLSEKTSISEEDFSRLLADRNIEDVFRYFIVTFYR